MSHGLEFSYTDEELNQIKEACTEQKPWDSKCIANVKRRIFNFHSLKQSQLCCYCYRDQYGEFKMVIDTEHILPKEMFSDRMFDIWNLSVSCKRCNMNIKGQKIDFLVDPEFNFVSQDTRDAYLFVHPNFDRREDHLERHVAQVGANRMVKYIIQRDSEKGRFSYQYFNLIALEIDSFDAAQSPVAQNESSATLDFFREIVRKLGG